MNGFPIIKMLNHFAADITKELIRLNPYYQQMRPSQLNAEVKEVVAEMLYEHVPTIYKEYRREKAHLLEVVGAPPDLTITVTEEPTHEGG